MLQRARKSGRYVFYPRVAEPGTGDADLEWLPACGRGTVYAVTVVRRKAEPAYNVVLVDLEEGVRMMSRVDGIPADAVKIGMSVQASIIDDEGSPVVVFLPRSEDTP